MKRSLAICVLALSVLGGCAVTNAPVKAADGSAKGAEAPAKAAKTPVADISKEDATTAYKAIFKTYTDDPVFVSYMKAVGASDYKTMREEAPKLVAVNKTLYAALKSADWPDEIQSDIDDSLRGSKKGADLLSELAATSTDEETKSVIDSMVAYGKSADGLAQAATGKKIGDYFGITS